MRDIPRTFGVFGFLGELSKRQFFWFHCMEMKMASGEEFVRLSHKELVNLSKQNASGKLEDGDARKSGKKHEERSKKPERQIYMPGQSRLSKKKDDVDQVALSPSDQGSVSPQLMGSALEASAAAVSSCGTGEHQSSGDVRKDSSYLSETGGKDHRPVSSKSYYRRRPMQTNRRSGTDADARDKQPHSASATRSDGREMFDTKSPCSPASHTATRMASNESKNLESQPLHSDGKKERRREKKPDIQLYIPKGRQQLHQGRDFGSDLAGANDPLVSSKTVTASDVKGRTPDTKDVKISGVNDLTTDQAHKTMTSDNSERKVTMKADSVFEVTISRRNETGSVSSDGGNEGSNASKKKRQPKPKFRPGDYRGQHDGRGRRKAVHDGRSPRQRLQHWRQATGGGNEAEECDAYEGSDVEEELEELEWDHQADLDVNHAPMGLLAIGGKQDAAEHGDVILEDEELEVEREEPLRGQQNSRRRRKKQNRRQKQAKSIGCSENDNVVERSDSANFQSAEANSKRPSSMSATNEDNFMGKFDVLVITNSRRLDSCSSAEAGQDSSHQSQSRNCRSGVGTPHKNRGNANSSRGRNEKTREGQERVQNQKAVGTKYGSVKGPPQAEARPSHEDVNPAVENKQKKKPSVEAESKTDSHESEKLSLSDITLTTKIGGIIRLPVGTVTSLESKSEHSPVSSRHAPHGPRSHGRGRAQSRRVLWDPNQPSKGNVGPEPFPGYFESHAGEQPAHYPYNSETGMGREYDYPASHPHPFYGAYPRCMPMDSYGYRYPMPAPCFDGMAYDPNMMRDLYYQGYPDQVAVSCQSMPSPQLTSLVREAAMLDNQLMNLISHGVNSEEALNRMTGLRMEILGRYEQAMLLDLDFCNQQNVGDLLWRSAFYQVIEVFRKQMRDMDSDVNRMRLMTMLEEGVEYFEKLLQKLQAKYNFSLERYLDVEQEAPECSSRTVKLGLISCQRIMMCLGDLARYKELANQSTNYGRARGWYMKAQQIAPKNGKPYNQLAVLALYTKRKLDAVYYYMRSLAATNPLLTARESLMSLFEEARRKMEQTEKARQQEKAQRRRSKMHRRASEQSHRVEIWISPDGRSLQDKVQNDDDDSDNISGLSVVELNKRFVLSFLHVHGKLFTKIGMESFPEAVGRMLQEFQILVRHSPSPIGYMRLLQLMTINMFAIENTIRRESISLDDGCRSVMQEQAMQLGLEMFGLLIEQCISLLQEHMKYCRDSGKRAMTFGEDLHELLPGVKAWCDWMICHSNLWNPPPVPFDPLLGPNVDVWKLMAEFFNVVSEVDTSTVVLHEKKMEDCASVLLPEDTALAGFIPLLSITNSPVYVSKDVNKELAQDLIRIAKLRMFAEVVYGLDPPILSYSAETCRYTSTVASDSQESVNDDKAKRSTDESPQKHGRDDDNDVLVESESVEYCAQEDDGQDHHISQLKARKQELTRQMTEKIKKQESLQAAFENSHHDFRPIELEIRPVFLVLDTNCLIDHLRNIQKLLASRKYTLTIPLVVINELDGLAKNLKESCYDTIEQAEMVRRAAETAVRYLEAEFENRNHYLRAVTSKGSTLDTISFRSEEPQDAGTNDDLILSCCLRYCKDKARDFMPKSSDEPIRLYRDVVLLTNDRNLRLKAHLHNVPVKDVPGFLQWANIG